MRAFRRTIVLTTLSLVVVWLCGTARMLSAAVRLPRIFGDNMVLQRGIMVPVWGRADPGEAVTVEFAEQKVRTKATPMSWWKMTD